MCHHGPGITVARALEAAAAELELAVPALSALPHPSVRADVVAVERGLSADDPGRAIVVDYDEESFDLDAPWEYTGLRVQVTFRPPVQDPGLTAEGLETEVVDIGIDGVTVLGAHGDAGGAYLLSHPGFSAMVNFWNTSGGPVPTPEDIFPFIQSLAR